MSPAAALAALTAATTSAGRSEKNSPVPPAAKSPAAGNCASQAMCSA